MVTKSHNQKVLIDLDKMDSMLYLQFYPKISHKNRDRIIEEMKSMAEPKEKPTDGNQ